MIDVPEAYYEFIFTKGTKPQKNYDYSAEGNLIYIGIADDQITNATPGWIVQKTIYVQITVQGSTMWVPSHSSLLEGVVWNDRANSRYIYP